MPPRDGAGGLGVELGDPLVFTQETRKREKKLLLVKAQYTSHETPFLIPEATAAAVRRRPSAARAAGQRPTRRAAGIVFGNAAS